jgi:hypothetical protein
MLEIGVFKQAILQIHYIETAPFQRARSPAPVERASPIVRESDWSGVRARGSKELEPISKLKCETLSISFERHSANARHHFQGCHMLFEGAAHGSKWRPHQKSILR